jgi:hypothetical protein
MNCDPSISLSDIIIAVSAVVTACATAFLVWYTRKYVSLTRDLAKIAEDGPQQTYELALKAERERRDRVIEECTSKLEFEEPRQEGPSLVLRIHNRSEYPIHDIKASITMRYAPLDVLVPSGWDQVFAWIGIDNVVPLLGDGLCWAARVNEEYKEKADIFSNDQQGLSLFKFNPRVDTYPAKLNKVNANDSYQKLHKIHSAMGVSSTEGFGRLDGPQYQTKKARVVLERKTYSFWIKIVSANTRARVWEFEVSENPTVPNKPVKFVREISPEQLQQIQKDILEEWQAAT